jgi:hypothetical protein
VNTCPINIRWDHDLPGGKEVPIGTCKLCLKTKSLRRSHFLGRAVYKRLRNPHAVVKDPIWISKNVALLTSRQTTARLLCAECEDRFSRSGENYVSRLMWNKGAFPFFDRLRVVPSIGFSPGQGVYSGPAAGIDTARLAYYAVSVVWRGAVNDWVLPTGHHAGRLDLRGCEEVLRAYLLGESGFPKDAAVLVTVATDRKSQCVAYEPSEALPHCGAYGFLVLGIHFYVFLAPVIPAPLRELCCVSSVRRPICSRNLEAHTDWAMGRLARTARVVGRLSRLDCIPPSELFRV